MARGVMVVNTPLSVSEAFDFMSDLRLFASWDPSVVRAVQVAGNGPGPDAEVDLVFVGLGPARTLRYRVVEFDPPSTMAIEASSRWLRSRDKVTVTPRSQGSQVVYEAELTLRGSLAVGEPVLSAAFSAFAHVVARGLRDALHGELA